MYVAFTFSSSRLTCYSSSFILVSRTLTLQSPDREIHRERLPNPVRKIIQTRPIRKLFLIRRRTTTTTSQSRGGRGQEKGRCRGKGGHVLHYACCWCNTCVCHILHGESTPHDLSIGINFLVIRAWTNERLHSSSSHGSSVPASTLPGSRSAQARSGLLIPQRRLRARSVRMMLLRLRLPLRWRPLVARSVVLLSMLSCSLLGLEVLVCMLLVLCGRVDMGRRKEDGEMR